ncbi:MAG TPA: hypothetical protein VKZ54_05130, partial [Membranihabitans sp.]|nr:hypothetical protein [Membranihabitans sp.]
MRKYLALLFFGVSGIAAFGQDVWTIERAMQHATENSLQIIQSRYETQRAEVDLSAIKQQRIPS